MRALVLSGGGAKGAWQVGALEAIYEDYDMICGVSVGALNGSLLATHDDVRRGHNELIQIWANLETEDVYKKWFMWPLSILWQPSVYDSSPLEDLIRNTLKDRTFKKRFHAGAVSYTTGEYYTFDEYSSKIVEGITASASFPGFLKPVQVGHDWWIDGGVRNVTPLDAAINRGATHIDVLTLKAKGVSAQPGPPTALKVLRRTLDLMSDEIVEDDLHHHDVTVRVFRPQKPLDINPLVFDPETSKRLIEQGFKECMKLRKL